MPRYRFVAKPAKSEHITAPPRRKHAALRGSLALLVLLLAALTILIIALHKLHPAEPVLYRTPHVIRPPDDKPAPAAPRSAEIVEGGQSVEQSVPVPEARAAPMEDPVQRPTAVQDRQAGPAVAPERPREATQSIVSLIAADLAKTARNDREKAAAIYYWLTRYLAYDRDVNRDGYRADQSPQAVIERGKAVCEGYVRLFKTLGDEMGLRVEIVVGLAKRYPDTTSTDSRLYEQHAWNAVFFEGNWNLFDATWGASDAPIQQLTITERQEYYFRTPPERLAYSHRPHEPSWQLGAPRLSQQAFLELPHLWPPFFIDGLQLAGPRNPVIAADGDAIVRLRVPEPVQVVARLTREDGTKTVAQPLILRNGEECEIRIDPLFEGYYLLHIFSKPPDQSSHFRCALDYIIERKPVGL